MTAVTVGQSPIRVLAVLLSVVLATGMTGCAGKDNPKPEDRATSSRATTPADALVVDVGRVVRPVNKDLLGFHGRDTATDLVGTYGDLQPRTVRHVMSQHDFVDFDCAGATLSPATVEYFGSWIEAVDAMGARPILSLSYVPPCYARDGQPKGPVTDTVGYRAFLDQLVDALVVKREAAGDVPLRYFELWNEPDIPLNPGDPSNGHGYVGTVEEFVATNLPSLAGAILAAEETSGVDIEVGTPAAFSPWPFERYAPTVAGLLEKVNGFPPDEAATIATGIDTAFGAGTSERVLTNGGLTWPEAVIAAAKELGLEIDFVSVHLYPNNPLQGVTFPEPDAPALLQGRNPFTNPDDFATLVQEWTELTGERELVLSEWALSAGNDDRMSNCEGAAFNAAALSVMQDAGLDRALYLSRPSGVTDAGFRAWAALPANQVKTTIPRSRATATWVTAASDDDRTTVLVSQWHTDLADAETTRLPVVVDGLTDGTYKVTVEWVGDDKPGPPGRKVLTATATDGRLTIDPIALAGQSVTRIDITRKASPLPPLTEATEPGPGPGCLPG